MPRSACPTTRGGFQVGEHVLWGPELRKRITNHLRAFARRPARSSGMRAAVGIVVLPGPDGQACVPLCLRAAGLRRHASQFALPGGMIDADESAVGAALRELHEELGVAAPRQSALGALDDFETRSGFTITPWVIWSDTPSREIQAAADEIAELHFATLREIEIAVAGAAPGASAEFSLDFAFAELFAPTAALLYQFSEVALNGRACRVADFYQPPFTSK